MQYMGSKRRIVKDLMATMLPYRERNQTYVEPFMGGCNSLVAVPGSRIAADVHPELVALFQAIGSGWVPPSTVSEKDYAQARTNPTKYPDYLRGFIGFGCSYGGKWFAGYARNAKGYNYAAGASRSLLKMAPLLQDVVFCLASYADLAIPPNSFIYCDPPYAGTTAYKNGFDSARFWAWCDRMIGLGHTVFVSEYSAPANWPMVWESPLLNQLSAKTDMTQMVERLFVRVP